MRQGQRSPINRHVSLLDEIRHKRIDDVGGEPEAVAYRVPIDRLADNGRRGINVALHHVSTESGVARHRAFTVDARAYLQLTLASRETS